MARHLLTLRIEGPRVTAKSFLQAANSFLGLLEEVAASVAGGARRVDWIVSVKRGSIVISAWPEARRDVVQIKPVIDSAYKGIRMLEKKAERPEHFSNDALDDARSLARLTDGKGITGIEISRNGTHVTVKERLVANVDAILGGTITDLGTIEGRLEMLSARGSLHCGIWDTLTDSLVRCYMAPEKLEEIKSAFGKRVAVRGRIHYKPNGQPVSIEVDGPIFIFPDPSELPTAADVFGILAES